jgi:haloalkane dehalogenase
MRGAQRPRSRHASLEADGDRVAADEHVELGAGEPHPGAGQAVTWRASMSQLARAAGLAYRSAGDSPERVALLVHGYPESSYMWRAALPALEAAGWRALAPDLPGYGDSEPDPPGTWERHVGALERFVRELGLGPVALITHDWGVPIGLRWACDHPGSVHALAISDGGFFSDRRWHDLANVMRTPDEGERLVRSYTREGFGQALRAVSSGMSDRALDEYWKAFADDTRRMGQLELYRSGDFEKLEPYEGRLAGLAVPALIVWGEQDRFASVQMAHRFHRELPESELAIFERAGHFVWEDEPERATGALVDFLGRRARPAPDAR